MTETAPQSSTGSASVPTPGPWKVCRNGDGEVCIGTDEDDPWYIAEMSLGAGGHEIEEPAEANAALIVKAVNSHDALVSALKGMVDMYADLVHSGDAGFWDPEKVDEVKHARAALAMSAGDRK